MILCENIKFQCGYLANFAKVMLLLHEVRLANFIICSITTILHLYIVCIIGKQQSNNCREIRQTTTFELDVFVQYLQEYQADPKSD